MRSRRGVRLAPISTHDARVPHTFAAAVLAFPLELPRPASSARSSASTARRPREEPRLAAGDAAGASRTLLEPAAVALDNALLLKRAEALSVTDDLTHLYNSRYPEPGRCGARRSAHRAAAGRCRCCSSTSTDSRAVNDTHGHLYGSRALVEAAAVIRGSARETDVVARFGGDEFAVVLPDTGSEGALAVGERVRERIAAHRFLAERRPRRVDLTASVGVATLPDVAALGRRTGAGGRHARCTR